MESPDSADSRFGVVCHGGAWLSALPAFPARGFACFFSLVTCNCFCGVSRKGLVFLVARRGDFPHDYLCYLPRLPKGQEQVETQNSRVKTRAACPPATLRCHPEQQRRISPCPPFRFGLAASCEWSLVTGHCSNDDPQHCRFTPAIHQLTGFARVSHIEVIFFHKILA
jgi:hypothetical protein